MHARVLNYIGHFGRTQEIVQVFHEKIVPAAQQQPGFVGGALFSDEATGKVLTISFWDTEAAMVRGEADGYLQNLLALTRRLAASEPTVEHYAVSEAPQLPPLGVSRHTSGGTARASAGDAPSPP